jgi:DNA-binding LacI/PurR family transcriptional regulator
VSTRRATIADVAREAGVSPSTASVVFSGKTPVSDATRRRVLDAAASLGYTGPDPRAASLRRGRSGIVGVVLEEHLGAAFLDPVTRLTMDGLTDAVAPLGAGLLLLRDRPDAAERTGDDEAASAPTLTTAPLDAAVLMGCSGGLRESLVAVRARGIPVVVVEGDAGADVPQIRLDNREAQRQAASHLRGLGHARVAIVTLPLTTARERGWTTPQSESGITVDVTRDRLAGARDVFPDAPAFASAGSSIDEGMTAGRVLFAADTRPTAVLAQSDLLATGVIRAAEEAGLRVPEDVSVTGFDGVAVDGLAPYRLTTLVQPATDKGRAAGQAVTAMLAGEHAASIRFTCTFREGNTTGPAPQR